MITNFDLSVKCPAMLKHYEDISIDGSGTKLKQLYIENQIATSSIRNALGMSEMSIVFDLTPSYNIDKYKECINLFKVILSREDLLSIENNTSIIFNNKFEDGRKLSRVLCKNIKESKYLLQCINYLSDYSHHDMIYNELPKLPSYNVLELIHNFDVVVQNFFSSLAESLNKEVVLSFDMFDIFSASNMGDTKSCFSFSGAYNNSWLGHSLGGNNGVIFVRSASGNIIGRSWIIFAPNKKAFFIQPKYGFMSNDLISAVSKWICYTLNKDKEWSYSSNIRSLSLLTNSNVAYRDSPESVYFYIDGDELIDASINYGSTSCIVCGSQRGVHNCICTECKVKMDVSCTICGKNYLSFLVNKKIHICKQCCNDNYHTCSICNNVIHGNFCSYCHSKNICVICRTNVAKDEHYQVNGMSICKACARLMLKGKCDKCGNVAITYAVNNQAMCMSCYNEYLFPDTESRDQS